MEFVIENWAAISGLLAVAGGSLAVTIRFFRNVAYKRELYQDDGQPVYLHKREFKDTEKKITKGIEDIQTCLTDVKKTLNKDRKINYGFMAAVKQEMDLNFDLPTDD